MREALTATWDSESSSDTQGWVLPAAEPIRRQVVESRSYKADLALRQALAAFDRARTWAELQPAQQRVISLGREVVPGVLSELAKPQPPERFDLLLALLVKWKTVDEVLEILRSGDAGWVFRASLAEVVGHYAAEVHPTDERVKARVVAALVPLMRDPNAGVRVAAVDAIGLAGLASDPRALEILRTVAAEDQTESVKSEARRILEDTR